MYGTLAVGAGALCDSKQVESYSWQPLRAGTATSESHQLDIHNSIELDDDQSTNVDKSTCSRKVCCKAEQILPIGGENTKRFVPHIAIGLHAGSVEELYVGDRSPNLTKYPERSGLIAEFRAWVELTKKAW